MVCAKAAVSVAWILLLGGMVRAAEPGLTDTEIHIGGHTSESGAMAIYSATARAASAYIDNVNEKGGVHGRKIKYTRIDTQGEHLKSAQATKKLVEDDKVFAFFFAFGPSHQPMIKYLMDKGVPDLYVTDNANIYTEPFKKTLFPATFSFASEARVFSTVAAKSHKGKKVCFLITDNAMGEEFLAGAKEQIAEENKNLSDKDKLKVGEMERVDRASTQANTQVLKLKKANCDVVMTSTYSGTCPNAITYAASQDFKPVWMVISWNATHKFLDLVPEGAREGIFTTTAHALDETFGVKGWDEFAKLMQKRDIPISRNSITGYSNAEMFVETLKRAGRNVTRQNLVEAAETLNGWTCSLCLQPTELTPTNHRPFSKPKVVVSKGGKWLTI